MEYKVDLPYPPVEVTSPNVFYGQLILEDIGGMTSEMSAISLYLYNYTIAGCNFKEVKETFYCVNMVEMHHIAMLSELALKLGVDPRLWTMCDSSVKYWSPFYNNYPNQLEALLKNAIYTEQLAIEQYQKHACMIKDPCVVAVLERIILDEQLHVELFTGLLKKLVRK